MMQRIEEFDVHVTVHRDKFAVAHKVSANLYEI
jgi:hypothetical protein